MIKNTVERMGWSWLIVGGCPRSGTTALNLLLNSHPAIHLTNENDFAKLLKHLRGLFYREELIKRTPERQMGKHEKWTRDDIWRATLRARKCLAPTLRTLYEAGFVDQVDLNQVRYFGDKLPTYYSRDFETVRRFLNPLKIIHVSRNPLAVVNSMLWRARNTAQGRDQWAGWTTVKEACDEWARAWNFVQDAQKNGSDGRLQLYHLKYEDLVSDAESTIRALEGFLGVSSAFDRARIVENAESSLEMITGSIRQEIERRLPGVVDNWDLPLGRIEEVTGLLPTIRGRQRGAAPRTHGLARRLGTSRLLRPLGAVVQTVLAKSGYELRRLSRPARSTDVDSDQLQVRSHSEGKTLVGKEIAGEDEILLFFLKRYTFETVLDVGCRPGTALPAFLGEGRRVTGIDLVPPAQIDRPRDNHGVDYIRARFMDYEGSRLYDAVICSHVVQHVADTESFLRKFFSCLRCEGAFCIIWPPPMPNVVGGQVHVFTMGTMLYNLVRLGIDCRDVDMLQCGYSLGIMGRLRRFELPALKHGEGDIEFLAPYFPFPAQQDFDGQAVPGIRQL